MNICDWRQRRRISGIVKITFIMLIRLRLISYSSIDVWRKKRMASTQALPQDNDAPEEQFLHKKYKHLFPQEYFQFNDDLWDLNFRATTASNRAYNRINFAAFHNAVKYDVKEYVIHGIYG